MEEKAIPLQGNLRNSPFDVLIESDRLQKFILLGVDVLLFSSCFFIVYYVRFSQLPYLPGIAGEFLGLSSLCFLVFFAFIVVYCCCLCCMSKSP